MKAKYPIADLAVGEDFTILDCDAQKVRQAMHNHGRRFGKYFVSKRYKGLGLIQIKRLA